MSVTVSQYYMGRDKLYADELTEILKLNAQEIVQRSNMLLTDLTVDGVVLELHPLTKSIISSGWRPQRVNLATANSAPRSKHMTCQAIDIYDPEGSVDDWCMENLSKLEMAELWLEHPSATKGWSHWQTIPPKSGKRVFYP